MEKVISQYTAAFDELNVLTETSYTSAGGDSEARVEEIADDILSFLIHAYTMGVDHASAMLDYALIASVDAMDEAIFLSIEGKTFEDRVADHVKAQDIKALQTLVESEFHRVYNAALYDGGEQAAKGGNHSVTKEWITVRDPKVRQTHEYLEGHRVALNDEFYTFDGDHAAFPGYFTKAENNVNCRCIIRLSRV